MKIHINNDYRIFMERYYNKKIIGNLLKVKEGKKYERK